jgi:hypothetical protein
MSGVAIHSLVIVRQGGGERLARVEAVEAGRVRLSRLAFRLSPLSKRWVRGKRHATRAEIVRLATPADGERLFTEHHSLGRQ